MHQGADAGEMELPQAKVQCNSCVSVRVPIIDIRSSKWVIQHVHCNLLVLSPLVTSDMRWKVILPRSFVEFTDDSCCCVIRGTAQINN